MRIEVIAKVGAGDVDAGVGVVGICYNARNQLRTRVVKVFGRIGLFLWIKWFIGIQRIDKRRIDRAALNDVVIMSL